MSDHKVLWCVCVWGGSYYFCSRVVRHKTHVTCNWRTAFKLHTNVHKHELLCTWVFLSVSPFRFGSYVPLIIIYIILIKLVSRVTQNWLRYSHPTLHKCSPAWVVQFGSLGYLLIMIMELCVMYLDHESKNLSEEYIWFCDRKYTSSLKLFLGLFGLGFVTPTFVIEICLWGHSV